MRRAIVLLSGGLDSTTILAVAKVEGFALYALSFDYGQRHVREIEAARKAADVFGVKEHKIIKIDLGVFGHSALTADISVPKKKIAANISSQIPITYVPARNTIFLSYALAWADVTGARDIFIGINAIDYSGYPDCRPEYVKAYEKMAGLATKSAVEGRPVKIRTPLINMTKSEIIKKGISLGVDYGSTHSCYDPDEQGTACGECASCLLRKKGFKEAGIEDPLKYSG